MDESEWEFPKIRGPKIHSNIVGLSLQGHPRNGPPQFTETANSACGSAQMRRSTKGPNDHIYIRISHVGSKANYKGDARNEVLKDPLVHVAFEGPIKAQVPCCTSNSFWTTLLIDGCISTAPAFTLFLVRICLP